ncbi:hypothetical protein COV04_03585 [Candidatus Uhrbacteria bacterium CG10_big_fil_rev_8_21_14_0_10_48_11]|uniref:Baseplate protein J-like domain-containing protein n=1 Tax=Candidatus Uhrbacteria bacterium CG10_big_fil_rev_8_21_14_0_10_48_11 TaxID=1975037 RepID=A0A2M8LDY1_9BACT|nr:MAG: hypothetical protein COV04_03585 [Candidatus Uhrbacteria bacterium CG10_big_fil_rev_8_21_14_0_10_48_11]
MGDLELLPTKAKLLRNIAISFVVLTVILLGFIAYTTLSRAVIVVHRHPVERDVSYKATLAEETIGKTLPDGAISATFLETTKDESDTFLLQQNPEPTAKAGGIVTIINTSDRAQPLVETTRLLTPDNILFRLTQAVRVPAGGQVSAVVEADGSEDSYLVGPSHFTIPGLSPNLQKDIYATSSVAMVRGGAVVREVTDQDIENAKQTLLRRALDAVKRTDGAHVASGDLTDADFITTALSEDYSSKTGDSAAALTATLRVRVIAVAFSKEALNDVVKNAAGGQVSMVGNNWQYTIADYDPIARTALISGIATVGAALDTTSSVFSPINFVGATPTEVKQFLSHFEGIDSVEVQLIPYWQQHLPRLPSKIELRFQ